MTICFNALKAQDFKYEDVIDDPEIAKFAQIGIGIWDMNLNGYNMQLWNFNPRLYFQYSKKFSIEAEYSRAIIDRFYPSSSELEFDGNSVVMKSQYNSTPATNFNLIGTWFFASKVANEEISHHLKTQGNTAYVSNIPTNILTSQGLRFGYLKGSSFYTLSGILTYEAERTDIPGQKDYVSINDGKGSTTIDYSMYRIGYSVNKTINKEIETDKYGTKSYRSTSYWYLDAFIPQYFNADDMYYNNYNGSSSGGFQLELYPVTINKMKKLPVGGCIGYRSEDIKGHGVGVGIEAGILPGFQEVISGAAYARVNLSYQFALMFGE